MFPSVQSERDDARVGDARQFVTEVEQSAARARGGGPAPRFDRIAGPDRTGTAFAVVDPVGRFVDIGLSPGWWPALGPARVAAGLLEALAAARLKAALVPMILLRNGDSPSSILVIGQPTAGDDGFLEAGRDRIAEAGRLIDEAGRRRPATQAITGPHGLFRLHVRGSRIDRAEVTGVLTGADTGLLVADAREAFTGLARHHPGGLASRHAADDRGAR